MEPREYVFNKSHINFVECFDGFARFHFSNGTAVEVRDPDWKAMSDRELRDKIWTKLNEDFEFISARTLI